MSGKPVRADLVGAAKLSWSFLWRLAVLGTLGIFVLGLVGALLLKMGALTPYAASRFTGAATPIVFLALQVEAFRRLAVVYDIRTREKHPHE